MLTLGIETSCDETAAAIVNSNGTVISSIVASQIELFQEIGGVVPELSARAHTEKIIKVIENCFQQAQKTWDDIDQIAVTESPGLIGSLLVGQSTAKALAYAKAKPLVRVEHLRAHVLAVELSGQKIDFPAIGLLVSGGHTELLLLESRQEWKVIGQTRDDAAGEAFDKVGALLSLGYPGGPLLSEKATRGDPGAFDFPRSHLEKGSLDFSFSGLKTAVLRQVKELGPGVKQRIPDLAASFQEAVVEILSAKTEIAIAQYDAKQEHQSALIQSVLLAGGVAANQALRQRMREKFEVRLLVPELRYCTDNAAMVAYAGMMN